MTHRDQVNLRSGRHVNGSRIRARRCCSSRSRAARVHISSELLGEADATGFVARLMPGALPRPPPSFVRQGNRTNAVLTSDSDSPAGRLRRAGLLGQRANRAAASKLPGSSAIRAAGCAGINFSTCETTGHRKRGHHR